MRIDRIDCVKFMALRTYLNASQSFNRTRKILEMFRPFVNKIEGETYRLARADGRKFGKFINYFLNRIGKLHHIQKEYTSRENFEIERQLWDILMYFEGIHGAAKEIASRL